MLMLPAPLPHDGLIGSGGACEAEGGPTGPGTREYLSKQTATMRVKDFTICRLRSSVRTALNSRHVTTFTSVLKHSRRRRWVCRLAWRRQCLSSILGRLRHILPIPDNLCSGCRRGLGSTSPTCQVRQCPVILEACLHVVMWQTRCKTSNCRVKA